MKLGLIIFAALELTLLSTLLLWGRGFHQPDTAVLFANYQPVEPPANRLEGLSP